MLRADAAAAAAALDAPQDIFTKTARVMTKGLIFVIAWPLLPLQLVTTFVGGCLIALTLGVFAMIISLIWLPFLGLLMGTSWLWLRAWPLRPILLLPGVLIAVICDILVTLFPDDRDAKYWKATLVSEWPLTWAVWWADSGEAQSLEREQKFVAPGGTRNGTIVTVFGAVGGIGKTIIAMNLAAVLAQVGRRVVIVDTGVRFGDVALLLDIPVERSIADLALAGDEVNWGLLRDCLYDHSTGVTVLPAPVRPADWRSVHASHIEKVVVHLTQRYDCVILDTPATYNDIVVKDLELAGQVLLVTTASPDSLENTRQAIDLLRSSTLPPEKVNLVVNTTGESDRVDADEIERVLGLEVLAVIPYDRNIGATARLGEPLVVSHPQSEAARILTQMTFAVEERIDSLNKPSADKMDTTPTTDELHGAHSETDNVP